MGVASQVIIEVTIGNHVGAAAAYMSMGTWLVSTAAQLPNVTRQNTL
jgi:hypothetical protein